MVTYLMFGTLQRKVLFDEYATCHQKEVWVVRMAAGVSSGARRGGGPSAPETLGYRASLHKVEQTLLEILQGLNPIPAELASICLQPYWPVCSCSSPHLEGLLVTREDVPDSLAGADPLGLSLPCPCLTSLGHPRHFLLVV